jgi:hypothetical protein
LKAQVCIFSQKRGKFKIWIFFQVY